MNTQLPLRAIALSLLFASGCQAPMQLHQLKQPWFALSQTDQTGPVIATSLPSSASGKLTVRFDGDLARLMHGRRIQAMVADVERVVVTVTPAGGTAVSETVLKAALNSGQTSVTFQGLTPGEATITITAYDAANANIGSTTRTATVTVGQVATVDMALQLSPTYVASGGGSSSPTTGGLATTVLIQDGPVIVDLPGGGVVESFRMPFSPHRVAVNGQGEVWVTESDSSGSVVVRLSSGGAILQVLPFPGTDANALVVDANDHVWVLGVDEVVEYSPAGAVLNQHAITPSIGAGESLRMDAAGRLFWYSLMDACVITWVPGSPRAVLDAAYGGSTVTPGSLGDLWVGVIQGSSDVRRISTANVELGRYSVGAGYRSAYTAIDAAGNAWVTATSADPIGNPLNGRVVKFSPTGAEQAAYELADVPMPNAIEIGPDGRVWVTGLDSNHQAVVTWLGPDGGKQGTVAVDSADVWGFAVGNDGAWLVAPGTQSLVHVAP
jgi:streptogramin lyase